jgi:hypothetical protein
VIGAVIALAVATAGLVWLVVWLIVMQARERTGWAAERLALVDRAIASHTGEVIALDRTRAAGKVHQPKPEPIEIEGLS